MARGTLGAVEPSVPGRKKPTGWGTIRPWQNKRRGVGKCSHCNGKRDRLGQRYCRACHAGYMRLNRPAHIDLPDAARRRQNARAHARVYLLRGKIKKSLCERCGSKKSEMHHDDYSKPTQVRWLCRGCHLHAHADA